MNEKDTDTKKGPYIELSSTNDRDREDISIEDDAPEESMTRQNQPRERLKQDNPNTPHTEEELKRMINAFDPPPIKDWPKIPYKTIAIIILLLLSSILFIYVGVNKYQSNATWDVYVSYLSLGILLIIPGGFYTFILVNVLIGTEGYEYDILPDLSDN